jgi:hypothetical protein
MSASKRHSRSRSTNNNMPTLNPHRSWKAEARKNEQESQHKKERSSHPPAVRKPWGLKKPLIQ